MPQFPDGRLSGQKPVSCRTDTMDGSPFDDLKKIRGRDRAITGKENRQECLVIMEPFRRMRRISIWTDM